MNNNDLAALAALGAMGWMYKNHLDKQGAGQGAGQDMPAVGYEGVVPSSELGSQGNFRFGTDAASAPEDRGVGAAGMGAAGLGAAGLGAAYWANKRLQERAIEEARARRVAETKRGILADRAQAGVDEDRAARAREQNEADRAARAQAEAEAEAKSRATQAEIDEELKRYKQKAANAKNDRVPLRSQVMNKDAWLEGPSTSKKITTLGNTTVSEPSVAATTAPRENAARMTAAQKAAAKQAADMEEFNRLLREQKVGPATEAAKVEEGKRIKARGVAGKVGLGLTALGLGTAANAATKMNEVERGDLINDLATGLILPIGMTSEHAGAPTLTDDRVSSAERKRRMDALMSTPEGKKKVEEALARQHPGILNTLKDFIVAKKPNEKAGGGQIKAKKMASGGMTSKVSSASKRGDGIASKGKTRCKMY